MQRCLETLTKPKKTHKTKKDIQTDATVPKNINGKKNTRCKNGNNDYKGIKHNLLLTNNT